jgi:hypothetical protein
MGMTGHDDIDAARNRIDLQGPQIVQNIDRQNIDRPARKSDDLGFGICASPVAGINVSSDRGNRSDAAQRVSNFGTPDVAAVDDVIDVSQVSLRLRPSQPVRIGDDPDLEGHRSERLLFRIGQPRFRP